MTTPPTYVAVDGGNSKTHVVLGDGQGRVLGFVHGPGSSPHYLGVSGSIELLDGLVRRAFTEGGLPLDTVVDRAEVYIAGADLPVEVDVLSKAVGEANWAREHRVDNDLFALLRAGTSNPDAVAVVCGAGINCVGRAADGRTARFPSLGQISGDWGGGHHLAELALWHAARGEDGRGPATALSAAVAAHFGRATVEEVSAGLHLGELDRQRIRDLAPVLFAVAAAGDPVARGVVAKQAREVVALATVAARRLGLLDKPHAVVLGGGVLAARHPLLHEAVMSGIQAAAPLATIGIVADPPVAGAALLALDAFGVSTPEVESVVRAALGTRAAAG
jgi:N-acetylglucosamine kinase-like BadF-type ATPase